MKMRHILLKTLKILALQGGTRHSVHISSTELSKKLNISQQSASRYIIELNKKGYIQKKYAQGGQIVNINDKGIAKLRKEFTEYGLIFGTEKKVKMVGTLETGLGEGGYYISKKGYMDQFDRKLNWTPYKGTFNLRLEDDEVPKIEAMKAAQGILIEGFEEEGRTFGKAWIFKCTIENNGNIIDECAIISPKRTHYKRVVEIISPEYLRKKLKVDDGAKFLINVDLGDS
jgi:riboflavin kinase